MFSVTSDFAPVTEESLMEPPPLQEPVQKKKKRPLLKLKMPEEPIIFENLEVEPAFKMPKTPWVNVPPPVPMQTSSLVSFYMCPRDRFLSANKNAIKFDSSGLHYSTLVYCKRCIAINKSLGNIISAFPDNKEEKKDETK